jgi:hypothetical protein
MKFLHILEDKVNQILYQVKNVHVSITYILQLKQKKVLEPNLNSFYYLRKALCSITCAAVNKTAWTARGGTGPTAGRDTRTPGDKR